MKSLVWSAIALLAMVPHAVRAERPVELQLTLRAFRADGSAGPIAMHSFSGEPTDSGWLQLNSAGCGVGAGSRPYQPSASPGAIVWRLLSGRIVEHTGDLYAVDVDVHRIEGATTRPLARSFKSHLGERVLIDEVTTTSSLCGASTARIEASVVVPADAPDTFVARGQGGSRTAVASGLASDFSGAAPGAAAALVQLMSPPRSNGVERSNWASGAETVPGVSDPNAWTDRHSIEIDLHALAAASFDAELWLVDTSPDRPPQTLRQIGHLDPSGRVFQFPLLTVLARARPVTMDVAVNLRPMATDGNQTVLRAAIARVVDGGQSVGLTSKAIPMPGPTAVVSFEMPPRVSATDPLGDHHQELRVRIAPGKGAAPR